MDPITLIEKLIDEHGSSAIFKKRLNLLRGQISALDNRNGALKSDNAVLKGRRKAIESQLRKATKQVERLDQLIQGLERQEARTRLDPVTEKVLKMFFYRRRELSVREVAATLSIDVRTVRYHFALLSENNLIEQTKAGFVSLQGSRRDPHFRLTSSGRKYVVKDIAK